MILKCVDFSILEPTVISEIKLVPGHNSETLEGILAEYLADQSLLNLDLKIKYS